MTATIIGTIDRGKWLGTIPLVRVQGKRPALRNNGFNCFSGQAPLPLPGLAEMLPAGRPQGHVELQYDDGGALLWASCSRGDEIYSFS